MNYLEDNERIYCEDEKGNIIAQVNFEKINEKKYNISHTFVDEKYRGKGIATKLVKMAVEKIEKENYEVTATCSYAKKWLEKNR